MYLQTPTWSESLREVAFIEPVDGIAEAPEGHISLAWSLREGDAGQLPKELPKELPKGAEYVLERSRSPDFADETVLYQGKERGTFVSGMAEGNYYFRVFIRHGERVGPRGDVLVVNVTYVERQKVVLLLAVGFLVFIATVGVIIFGSIRSNQGELN